MNPNKVVLSVSQFVDVCNQTLDFAFMDLVVEGEVASFKINQGKWVFFDLKEGDSNVSCFMALSAMRHQITDGMKIRVAAIPRLTRWGKFSLTVRQIIPVGEGNIKKSFELLKKKLAAEGLFNPENKRPLPSHLSKIGVISSTAAAGYIDFLKILENRWGGMEIKTVNTQVQGMQAAEQIIRALKYFNEHGNVEVITILRGGGSADDLAAFNDEELVRAIAASKIPVITGIGHEIDESLADLAADIRASTPSNAAERLTPDRYASIRQAKLRVAEVKRFLLDRLTTLRRESLTKLQDAKTATIRHLDANLQHIHETQKVLLSLSPESVLRRGYAIISGAHSPGHAYQIGDVVKITTLSQNLTMEVKNATKR